MKMRTPIFCSVKEGKQTLNLGTTKFYELLNAGEIEAVKSGRKTLIVVESLHRYAAKLPRRPTKPAAGGTTES